MVLKYFAIELKREKYKCEFQQMYIGRILVELYWSVYLCMTMFQFDSLSKCDFQIFKFYSYEPNLLYETLIWIFYPILKKLQFKLEFKPTKDLKPYL